MCCPPPRGPLGENNDQHRPPNKPQNTPKHHNTPNKPQTTHNTAKTTLFGASVFYMFHVVFTCFTIVHCLFSSCFTFFAFLIYILFFIYICINVLHFVYCKSRFYSFPVRRQSNKYNLETSAFHV